MIFKIQWTSQCTLALLHSKQVGNSKPLKKLRKKQKKMLLKFSDAIRGDLKKIDRLKIVSLVTIEIHARDVVDQMYNSSKWNKLSKLKLFRLSTLLFRALIAFRMYGRD